jgi:putative toxin-antitoxin system antitoxin component (TIGR02293 family)
MTSKVKSPLSTLPKPARASAASRRRPPQPPAESAIRFYLTRAAFDPVASGFLPGVGVEELTPLQAGLAISKEQLAELLDISKATLHRLQPTARLGASASDRAIRYARLMGLATHVFQTEEAARIWFHSPQFGLGGKTPFAFARTELGAREVENLLGRIEYGVYS